MKLMICDVSEGSWGVLGVLLRSGGSGRARGGVRRSQGGSEAALGGALGILHFLFSRSEIVNGLRIYRCFQFGVVL